MDRRALLAAARALLAALVGVAIVAQLAQSSDAGTLVPLNFASYFTIQSNVIGLVVFLVGARAGAARRRLAGISSGEPRR